ncbi:hypothetical protein FQN54_006428 [Arachnomyces sp. PD_36]|nr:hypothetical protein FQN54_006428 [Arachnomyces sp. PD_36]
MLLSVLAGALVAASPALSLPSAVIKRDIKPIYAIAHKILTTSSLEGALSDGANALEIDLNAWQEGEEGTETSDWWCQHDHSADDYGDRASDMFKKVTDQQAGGKTVSFVILDIKNPNHCEDVEGFEDCGIAALREMARNSFGLNGIRVIYGLHTDEKDTTAFRWLQENLNELEGIRLNGEVEETLDAFEDQGSSINASNRVFDYGVPYLNVDEPAVGDCTEDGDEICAQLLKASEARDGGRIGKVFLWTLGSADGDTASLLLDEGGVDGIVYGYANAEYESSEQTQTALGHITGWVDDHADTHKYAGQLDYPF